MRRDHRRIRHELEREIGSHAMDPGQILSKQGMERFADFESGPSIAGSCAAVIRTICPGILLRPRIEMSSFENRLDPDVAGGDLLLITS